MGAQGVTNGLGHLIGGTEIGAIASAFGIALAIGLNAGVGILLILLLTVLTPLVRNQGLSEIGLGQFQDKQTTSVEQERSNSHD